MIKMVLFQGWSNICKSINANYHINRITTKYFRIITIDAENVFGKN
jgi:hypothetical protein